jgi:S1-C subfamily serine protease
MRTTPLTADAAQELKVDAGTKGLLVAAVQLGSPAFEAGLSRGDVITAVNGKAVTTQEVLNRAVTGAKSGDLVTFTVLRASAGDDKPSEAVVNVEIP